jgi:uncharacterized protein
MAGSCSISSGYIGCMKASGKFACTIDVPLNLDPTTLYYVNDPRIRRADHDIAEAWSKMCGSGRAFYLTLGDIEESWSDPDIRKVNFEAIRWVRV